MGCFIALVDGIKNPVVDQSVVMKNKDLLSQRYQIIEGGGNPPDGKPLLVYFEAGFPEDRITIKRTNDGKQAVIYVCGEGQVKSLIVSVGSSGQNIKLVSFDTHVRRDNNCLHNLLLSIMFDRHQELSTRTRRIASRVLLAANEDTGRNYAFVHATFGQVKLYLNYKIRKVIIYLKGVKQLVPFDMIHTIKD